MLNALLRPLLYRSGHSVMVEGCMTTDGPPFSSHSLVETYLNKLARMRTQATRHKPMTARLSPKLTSREEPNYWVATMTAWRRSNDFAWMILCDAHHTSGSGKKLRTLDVAEEMRLAD
jgi:hypothetical protein